MRQVLKTVRKEILKGCKLVFSRVFPTNFLAENHHLWKTAEQLGATCSVELDPSVTHVVSMDAGTDKSHWATRENKFLVSPKWIESSNYMWQKQPEENFPVLQAKNKWSVLTSNLYQRIARLISFLLHLYHIKELVHFILGEPSRRSSCQFLVVIVNSRTWWSYNGITLTWIRNWVVVLHMY